MTHRLSCPNCLSQLNPREDLVLTAANRGKRGLVLLHPEPGNYRVALSDGLPLAKGDVVDFSCPVCQASLVSKLDQSLVQLDYASKSGDERGIVVFSRVYGDHATFIVNKQSVAAYGKNAPTYTQRGLFIGLRWD